jgi:hypothetical protein
MSWRPKAVPPRERGAALIIALAFAVLLTGVALAYLSRATSDRQVAHSSFNQSNVDQLAQSAMDNIIGDLRQEIVDGSTATTLDNGVTIYTPLGGANANMVPQRGGSAAGVPNLIRRSGDSIPPPGLPTRASAVNSTSDASANGRYVTSARWNSHSLGTSATSPDWVFVTRDGAAVITQPSTSILGRYACTIYDEGGLLDMNIAGYPTRTTVSQYSGKRSLAFADLRALPSPILNPTSGSPVVYEIDKFIGWRNYATTLQSATNNNDFPDVLPTNKAFARNFQATASPAASYYSYVANNGSSFLGPTPTIAPIGRTDQVFLGRQQLIAYQRTRNTNNGTPIANTSQFDANALPYLGTFSREALAGAPQWTGPSPTPTSTNANFQTLLVTGSFTRNDGTTANVGDYFVNKRFLLQRLNWLTYNGPSASRSVSDPDMSILINTYGLTSSFLQQGTAANILKYFGLAWDTTNERWNYVGHGGSSVPIDSIASFGPGGTNDPNAVPTTRELDFFELVQAAILNGSLGDASSSDPALPSTHQQSKMLHILTIGANLIAQSRVDSYPVRIACSVNVAGTPTVMEAVGMPRLPCLSSLAACPVAGTGLTGGVNWFLIPNLWDPFRNTWDLTEHTSGTPNYPRPPVRITVSGGISFGSATVSQSGSVDPTSVTPFIGASTSGINASLTLATGDNTYGRDGLREAMRLGTSDISGTVQSFDPTQSPGLQVVTQWNRVARPAGDGSSRNDNYIVFRLSLPGHLILPLSILGQKPVLILQPGFQVSLEYQSPNGQWYPYSFLQGNNAGNTWITANPTPGLCLGTSFSQYGLNPALPPPPTVLPTIINSGPPLIGQATLWTRDALAQAPMFAKADPRSIRCNTQIGVITVAANSAGMIGSIWPSQYAAPPPMSPSGYPTPTPTPNPNPATLGDNAPAGNTANPYNEVSGDDWRPVMMNRPFRSVGEMGYAFRDQPFRTLSFSSANSPDAALLDLFSVNDYITPSSMRAGIINLNSQQTGAIAAVLASTIRKENTLTPSLLTASDANSAATSLASVTSTTPAINKGDLATLIASPTGLGSSVPKTERESIARALGEADQTRTWNLLIDVIAQIGKYAPGESNLTKFNVEGEQRYWVHVAIDRFTGQVIDKQIEVVNE